MRLLAFRYREGARWNVVGLTYGFGGYAAGVVMLAIGSLPLKVLGVLLVAHTLSILSYFFHELAHGTIFAAPRDNALVGRVITWLNGSCFSGYSALRELHLKHHAARADLVRFDFKAFLQRTSRWLRWPVLALEWLHFPAIEFLMRGHAVWMGIGPGATARSRFRTLALLATRVAFFVVLGTISLAALGLYAVAYTLFVCFMRFFDAHQHTYQAYYFTREGRPVQPAIPARDRGYEHGNTYSNLISTENRWLNLLSLNFAYHGAHHARPAVAWYQLPRLHRDLYAGNDAQVLPARRLLWNYHRNRINRIVSSDYGALSPGADKTDGFLGAVGVSFLY
jgi:fatty acid desaturase